METQHDLERIRTAAFSLTGEPREFDPLIEMIGDASIVMIGEASHGTHEFYRARSEITRRLIAEKSFRAVAVEADWPDAYRVNRWVRALSDDRSPVEALGDFRRFPTWMWRNTDVVDFAAWLRESNDRFPRNDEKTGFYGIDLYSLYTSIEAVVRYLDQVDPEAAKRARTRYSCFEHYGDDSQAYGYATSYGIAEPCEDEVVAQLVEIQRKATDYAARDGHIPPDEAFFAEQNARLVKNAEEYYRSMFRGRVSSWNLRDAHMADTVDALVRDLERKGQPAKVVVWAHNSHLGDARATEMARRGELNVGQLLRERYGDATRNIGFTTYSGTVTASSNWDAPAERKTVRPGLSGSWEKLLHEVRPANFGLVLRERPIAAMFDRYRLERAIGVIYAPETERVSHYFEASLARQFDAVLHYDSSTAVVPLERWPVESANEPPETFPSGR
jgi:erythromycin esterase-like protein